ncbi:hypothetical protein ACTZNG_26860 [Klebsiella pneumoniae]
MTIMKVHYSPTDGIPLHSLYLKETSTTERSGSVLGGGISGDSVILGGGGYAGSEALLQIVGGDKLIIPFC